MEKIAIHEIRFCHQKEQSLLLDFIDRYWKKGHIFTKDTNLLDWQHLDKENHRYNFVVAYNQKTNEFDAILGFIPTSQYDDALKKYNQLWLAIWKIKESMLTKVSGLQLLFYLNSKLKPTTICSIGITDNVKNIYDALKYKRGVLSHFFIMVDDYMAKISTIKKRDISIDTPNEYLIREVTFDKHKYDFDTILSKTENSIAKTSTYIKNKFVNHPSYEYLLFGIFLKNKMISFFIVRKIDVDENSCLRIVDYFGDFINVSMYKEFQRLLLQKSSEYIDLLCHLPDTSLLKKMGFVEKMSEDIIPEYFEPFEKKNVSIDFAYKSKKCIRIFKADSDQDRPSQTISRLI